MCVLHTGVQKLVTFQVSVTGDSASGLHVRCRVLRPPNPRFIVRQALFSLPPCAENTACVLKMIVCKSLFVGEWKASGRSIASVRTVRNLAASHLGLLTLHNHI